jgi:hypothetical protein
LHISFDFHEDPVTHLRVHHDRFQPTDLHCGPDGSGG